MSVALDAAERASLDRLLAAHVPTDAREAGHLDDDQNFFDAGGNSLMATRVVARLRQQFGVDLPMRRFFDAPSVAEVSKVVEELLIHQIEALSEDEAMRLLEE